MIGVWVGMVFVPVIVIVVMLMFMFVFVFVFVGMFLYISIRGDIWTLCARQSGSNTFNVVVMTFLTQTNFIFKT
jgi:hypothetical protein